MGDSCCKLAVTMPVTRVEHCPEAAEWVACLSCQRHLGLVQPMTEEPERLVGTCEGCGRWYLIDWHPGSLQGVMLLLPDHDELLSAYGAETSPESAEPG